MYFQSRADAYIRAHHGTHGDAALASALGVTVEELARARRRLGLEREKLRDAPAAGPSVPLYLAQLPTPVVCHRLSLSDVLCALCAALVALALYVWCISPVIPGEDAGELVVSAYRMGIAHPPGYPLWCLLGKLFTYFPYGSIAWRVGLMSAVFGAGTVFLACLFLRKLGVSMWAAFLGALALGFSGEFWQQSVFAEVYTLNAFLVMLCVLLLYVWYAHRRDMALYAFAVAYGLGLTNHNTMMLLGPVFVAFVVYVEPMFWKRWPVYALCTGLAVACLSIYLYLPIRSAADPPTDWGNPESWEGFWDHVTREQYKFGFTANPRSVAATMAQTWEFVKLYAWEFTPWFAWLPLAGMAVAWRRNRVSALLLGAVMLEVVIGLLLVLNFKIDRESVWLNNVFWVPAYMMAALFLAFGLDAIGQLKLFGRRLSPLAIAAGIGVLASSLIVNFGINNKHGYRYADDFGRNCLATLEQDAIYFPSADHATFPALYLQAAEGLRPDVAFANKYGYPEEELYKDMPFEMRAGFRKIPTSSEEEIIENWIIQNTERPVYFTKRRNMEGLPGYKLANAGLMYRVVRPGENLPQRDYWAEYAWHDLDPSNTHRELTADFVLADYYFLRGRDMLAAHEQEKGLQSIALALEAVNDNKESLNNAGSVCAEYGFLAPAEEYFRRCVELDPKYATARRNLAKVYLQGKKTNEAILQFEELLKQDPKDIETVRRSAECLKEIGWRKEAAQRYQYLAELLPNDAQVHRELGLLYVNELREPVKGQAELMRSLELDSSQADLAELVARPPKPTTDDPSVPTAPTPEPPIAPAAPDLGPALPKIPGVELPVISGGPQVPGF